MKNRTLAFLLIAAVAIASAVFATSSSAFNPFADEFAGGVSGSMTRNQIPKVAGASKIADSGLNDDGTTITSSEQFKVGLNPAGTSFTQAALLVNPAAAGTNELLAGFGVNGTTKWQVDAEGDGSFAGTLTVTGASTLTGAAAINGGATVAAGQTLAVTDADKLTVGGVIIPQEIEVTFTAQANGTNIDQAFFVANQAYQVTKVREVHSAAGNDAGTVVVQLVKDTGTNAPGAGTDLLTNNTNAGFDLKGTANTVQTGTLTGTTASLQLGAGDRLSVDYAGTITNLAGTVITVTLKRI